MNYKLMNRFTGTIIFFLVSFLVLMQVDVIRIIAVENEAIEIFTIEDLANVNNNLAGNYILMNDLDLSFATSDSNGEYYNEGKGWLPLGILGNPFKGTFDGNGYTIKGLTINRASNYLGLFGFTRTSTIKNIVLEEVNIIGRQYIGGLVGQSETSTISRISVSGSVKGEQYVGGLLGYTSSTNTNFVYSKVNVFGNINGIGGIIGRMASNSTLEDVHSTSNVIAQQCGDTNYSVCQVGGIVGQMNSTTNSVINALFNGTLTNKNDNKLEERGLKYYAKPIIGFVNGGIINNLYYHLDYPSEYEIQIDKEELMLNSSYPGFDFDNVWTINQTAKLQGLFYFEEPISIIGIEIYQLPNQLVFDEDEEINLEGLVVAAIYSDKTKAILEQDDYEVLVDKENGSVIITYHDFSSSFEITINPVFYYQFNLEQHGYGGEVVVFNDDEVIYDGQLIRQGSVLTVKTPLMSMGRVKHLLLNNEPLNTETFVVEQDTTLYASFYLLGDVVEDGILNHKDLDEYVNLIYMNILTDYSDSNEDSKIDVADFVTLNRYLKQLPNPRKTISLREEIKPTINVLYSELNEKEVIVVLHVISHEQGALYFELNPEFKFEDLNVSCNGKCNISVEKDNHALIVYPNDSQDNLEEELLLTVTFQANKLLTKYMLHLSNIEISNGEGTLIHSLDDISISVEQEVIDLPKLKQIKINEDTIIVDSNRNEYVYNSSNETIEVDAVALDEAFAIGGKGPYILKEGNNAIRLIVSNNNQENVYVLSVLYSINDKSETDSPGLSDETDDSELKDSGSKNQIDDTNHKNESDDSDSHVIPETSDTSRGHLSIFLLILGLLIVNLSYKDKNIAIICKK